MSESLFSIKNTARILALFLLCLMLAMTIKNSVLISQGNEKIQAEQLKTLTNVLISQASLSASGMILHKDQEALLALANQLAHDRLVLDASIYDAQGVRLASSQHALSVRERLGLDTPLSTASIGRQQLVEPVLNDGEVIGFVRITFEAGKVTAISNHHYRKSDRYMYMMVLMSFFCGVLFTLIWRKQPIRRKKSQNLLLTNGHNGK